MRLALRRIRRGLLLEVILGVVILGLWGGFQWAGLAVNRIESDMKVLFENLEKCWRTREAEPGEVPSFVTTEEGVERRWKKVLIDRAEQQRLMAELDGLDTRMTWLRGWVSALMFVLLAFPLFRILATWWSTALPLGASSEETWRWVTRMAAVATGLAMWVMLFQTAGQPALTISLRSDWAQIAGMLTAMGTLRYLTTVALVIEDRDYVAHNQRIVRLLQILAVAVLAQIFLPRAVAAMVVWLNVGLIILALLASLSYFWQLLHLRASIAAVLNGGSRADD